MFLFLLYHIRGICQYKLKKYFLKKENVFSKSNIRTVPSCAVHFTGRITCVGRGINFRVFDGRSAEMDAV